jgi:hypothetical protein
MIIMLPILSGLPQASHAQDAGDMDEGAPTNVGPPMIGLWGSLERPHHQIWTIPPPVTHRSPCGGKECLQRLSHELDLLPQHSVAGPTILKKKKSLASLRAAICTILRSKSTRRNGPTLSKSLPAPRSNDFFDQSSGTLVDISTRLLNQGKTSDCFLRQTYISPHSIPSHLHSIPSHSVPSHSIPSIYHFDDSNIFKMEEDDDVQPRAH